MLKQIPIFPLNIFLLPGDYTQLYIFEERYKQLINDCLENQIGFGIAYTNTLNAKNYGSLVEVVEVVKRYEGGEMDIIIKATGVFKLGKYYLQKENKLYPGGEVEFLKTVQNHQASEDLVRCFKKYLLTQEGINSKLITSNNLGIYDIANELYMNDYEKLELMDIQTSDLIDQYLLNYIRYLELLQQQEKSVFQNIYLN